MPSSKRSTGARRLLGPPEGGLLAGLRPRRWARGSTPAAEPKPPDDAPKDDGRRRWPAARRRQPARDGPGQLQHRAGAGHGALDEVVGDARRHLRRGRAGPDVQASGPSGKPEASVQPSTDDPDTGTPSTAGWPLPDHRATPVPAPPDVSASTRANEAGPMGEGAHLAGDGGQHAVGSRTRHAQAGVQGRDEGGRAGCVDPEQAAATAGDDGVSGEDFTAVRHGLQPSDRRRGLADRAITATPGVHQVTRGAWDRS